MRVSRVRGRVVAVMESQSALSRLVEVLMARGFEVSGASTTAAGLDLIRQVRPDAVVCAYAMPRVDGVTLARAIRAGDRDRDVPIVLSTLDPAHGYLTALVPPPEPTAVSRGLGWEALAQAVARAVAAGPVSGGEPVG